MYRFFLLLTLCVTIQTNALADDERGYAIAWMQNSAEYNAILSQTFKNAEAQLEEAVFNSKWTAAIEQFEQNGLSSLPNAIILDLDDTLISTMFYQGDLYNRGKENNLKDWQRWVLNERAPLIKHSLTLIKKASSLGVTVLLMSNRVCYPNPRDPCPAKTDAAKMLKRVALSFPKDHMFFQSEYVDWTADQTTRRAFIMKRYRILMIVGDDLNQMIPNAIASSTESRMKLVNQYNDMWGSHWFMLPNPVYGSWRQKLPKNINKSIKGYK